MKTFDTPEDLKRHYVEVRRRIKFAACSPDMLAKQEEARRAREEELERMRRDREAQERALLESKAEQERAAEWLRTVVAGQDTPFVPAKAILHGVARKYGLFVEDLCRPRGKAIYDYIRFEAVYLMHLRKFSSPTIGKLLNRDHSTIIAAIRRYKQMMERGEVENYGRPERGKSDGPDRAELSVSSSLPG